MATIRAGFSSGDNMLTVDPTGKAMRLGLYNAKGEFTQFSAKSGIIAAATSDTSSPWAAAVNGSDLGVVRITSFYVGIAATAAGSATIQLIKTKSFSSLTAAISAVASPVDTNSQVMGNTVLLSSTASSPFSTIVAQFSIAATVLVPTTFAAQTRGQTINSYDFVQVLLPALGPTFADGFPLRGSEEALMLAQSSTSLSGQSVLTGITGSIEPYFTNNAIITQPSTYNY